MLKRAFRRAFNPKPKKGVIMSDELEKRRQFIKRAAIAGSVLAGSVVATAATTERNDRGATNSQGNGVVVGRSTKKEILYKKSAAWEQFYKVAK